MIDKDTQLCMSLAARPGNFGTRFHNYLYGELGLNFVYKAFTTTDLPAAIGGVRALGIRGCAISMPFKEDVIDLVDEMDPSARAIESVNTIVNNDGHLVAYNTDYIAIAGLLKSEAIDPALTFVVRGSGGMAKAVTAALRDSGFTQGTIVARNEETGSALAKAYGFQWAPDVGNLRAQLLVNVTPIGMAAGPDAESVAFEPDVIDAAQVAFDVVAIPAETPFIRAAAASGKQGVKGSQVIAIQALEQFVLYTGVRPSESQIEAATIHARQ